VQPLPLPLIEQESGVDEDGGEVVVSVVIVKLDCDLVIIEAGIELFLEEVEVLIETDVILEERLLDPPFEALVALSVVLESCVAEREGDSSLDEDFELIGGFSD
jgi:hypothetical protein